MKALLLSLLIISPLVNGQTPTFAPLKDQQQWQLLNYDGIPANQVQFSPNSLTIKVNQSASPLIYPLPKPLLIDALSMNLSINGQLNLSEHPQGESQADDFIFRIGVVYQGNRQLSLFQKAFAPKWVQTLFQLAPTDTGISYIHFFNVYSDDRLSSSRRTHPASELIVEDFEIRRTGNQMSLKFQPETNKKVLALWISSDGDDTASNYQITLRNLIVQSQ